MMRTKPKEKTGKKIVRAKRGDEREKKKNKLGRAMQKWHKPQECV